MNINFLLRLIFICFFLKTVASSHFRGAIIQWRPLDSVNFNGQIEIMHRISWRRSSGGNFCDESTISSGTLIGVGSGNLDCRIGCGGAIGDMSYFCTDFSATDDWTTGVRNYIYDASGVTYFEASYTSCCWITLVIGGGSASWEVRVKANLAVRADSGRINSSPVTAASPIYRLQHGCNHTLSLPVEDVDGDIIRCRWAQSSQGECAGVCEAFPGTLDENNCILYYEATGSVGMYGVALQIEDFATSQDTVPLSSVPLQFLVSVFSSSASCASRPELVGDTRADGSCIAVPLGSTYHEPIIAQSSVGASITAINTISPQGLVRSALTPFGAQQWYINVTWTPTADQIGPNILCFSAEDSNGLTSEQRCITLLAGGEAPEIIASSLSPTGMIFPNHSQWSLQFDRPFQRPSDSRYIRIFDAENVTEVITIDATSSSQVTYPSTNVSQTLSFETNYTFTIGRSYFVLLDPGIAFGQDFCGLESAALTNSSFWTVTVVTASVPVQCPLDLLNSINVHPVTRFNNDDP